MSQLEELYQEIVLEHYSRPRNFKKLEGANRSAQGYNPFCGDKITVYLKIEDGVIADVGFQGSGCVISKATASLMTESVKGKRQEEAVEIFHSFHNMLTRPPGSDFDNERLGDLEILAGVSEFPIRVKCAVLCWHTLRAALEQKHQTVSTE
ncbi:MAG: SUF system NifU family Fe-S cluster assembly protein [Chloroflexi bacterium]|nr:SUF system NifU family Fe-S cluster assembly protein [Chloroflexota bacterium]